MRGKGRRTIVYHPYVKKRNTPADRREHHSKNSADPSFKSEKVRRAEAEKEREKRRFRGARRGGNELSLLLQET